MRKLGRRARVQGRLARKVRRNLPGVSECRDVWRARRAETCRVSASARTSPTVIARSEATWQSASPAAGHDRKQCFGRIRESAYEFALRITNLQSFSAGTRIAAPVCALVRNDMLKEEACVRVQGRLARGHAEDGQVSAVARTLSGSAPWQTQTRGKFLDVIARSEATWQSVLLRQHEMKSNTLGEYGKVHTNLP